MVTLLAKCRASLGFFLVVAQQLKRGSGSEPVSTGPSSSAGPPANSAFIFSRPLSQRPPQSAGRLATLSEGPQAYICFLLSRGFLGEQDGRHHQKYGLLSDLKSLKTPKPSSDSFLRASSQKGCQFPAWHSLNCA